MKKRRWLLSAAIVLSFIWVILSVYGAFLLNQQASVFFQSIPLCLFWFLWVFFLFFSFFLFSKLWRQPFLLMIHLGVLFVFLGGIWGSPKLITLCNRLFGREVISKGLICLPLGEKHSRVYDSQGKEIGRLPFDLHLENFDVFYYDNPSLIIQDKESPDFLYMVPIQTSGPVYFDGGIELEVLRQFQHLQIIFQDGRPVPAEGPPGQPDPGFEIKLRPPDGKEEYHYVWQGRAVHSLPKHRFRIQYQAPQWPRQYRSQISIWQADQQPIYCTIEVNRPFFYKGYLFYQSSWGQDEKGLYSVIGVVNNSGLTAVFFGYGLLALGTAGQCWFRPLLSHILKKKERLYRN